MIKSWFVILWNNVKISIDTNNRIRVLEKIMTFCTFSEEKFKEYITVVEGLSGENKLGCHVRNGDRAILNKLPFAIYNIDKRDCLTFFDIKRSDYKRYINHSINFEYDPSLKETIEIIKTDKKKHWFLLYRYAVTFIQIKNELQNAKRYHYQLNGKTLEKISFIFGSFKKEVSSLKVNQFELEGKYNEKFNEHFGEMLDDEIQYITKNQKRHSS